MGQPLDEGVAQEMTREDGPLLI